MALQQSSNFQVFIPFLGKEQYQVQSIELPGLSVTPLEAFSQSSKRALIGGDSINLDPVTIEFVVDEKLELYKKVMSYFHSICNVNDGFINPEFDFTCGIEITDNMGISLICMQLYGCRIELINSLQYSANQEDNDMILSVTLKFDDYEFIDKSKFKELYLIK